MATPLLICTIILLPTTGGSITIVSYSILYQVLQRGILFFATVLCGVAGATSTTPTLSKHLGPFRLWKLSLTFCSLIFTIDIAKKRQPKALEWNSEFGWQVLEAKKYHTILLPCYLKMVHLHIHLYKKCIWTIFISIQRIEYHIYTPINMF